MDVESNEDKLRWRLEIDEDDCDENESGNEEILKKMVRKTYLHHLRKNLLQNIEASENYDIAAEGKTQNAINQCLEIMEERALRLCMVTKLYQKTMAEMIKDVKSATLEKITYGPLARVAQSESISRQLDKGTQTQMDQTDKQTQTMSELICDSSARVIVNGEPITTTASETFADPQSESIRTPLTDTESQSDLIDKPYFITVNGECKMFSLKRKRKAEQPAAVEEELVKKNNCTMNDEQFTVNEQHSITNGSAHVDSTTMNRSFEMRLKSASFCESVAQWYSLEYELKEMNPLFRIRLEETYRRVFGVDHGVDYLEVNEEQKSIVCRKRIAKQVVYELTTFYLAEKIASKNLFKNMAKYITSELLLTSLCPHADKIKAFVEAYFANGRIITSERDFFL